MAEPEPPLYLFDEFALEGALANGSAADHAKISGWQNGTLCVTKAVKEQFLGAFPEDKERLLSFYGAKRKLADNHIAAGYGDQLQNLPDIESKAVQGKIFLLAMVSRMGATLVTGETIGITTWIKALAEQLGVPCMTLEQFLAQ